MKGTHYIETHCISARIMVGLQVERQNTGFRPSCYKSATPIDQRGRTDKILFPGAFDLLLYKASALTVIYGISS